MGELENDRLFTFSHRAHRIIRETRGGERYKTEILHIIKTEIDTKLGEAEPSKVIMCRSFLSPLIYIRPSPS